MDDLKLLLMSSSTSVSPNPEMRPSELLMRSILLIIAAFSLIILLGLSNLCWRMVLRPKLYRSFEFVAFCVLKDILLIPSFESGMACCSSWSLDYFEMPANFSSQDCSFAAHNFGLNNSLLFYLVDQTGLAELTYLSLIILNKLL